MKKLLLIIIITSLSFATGSAQIISINTNAMLDAMRAPAFGFELVLNKRSSLAVDGFCGRVALTNDRSSFCNRESLV